MKKFSELTDEEKVDYYSMVIDEFNNFLENVQKKTGYHSQGLISLYSDELRKCLNVDLELSLIEKSHGYSESKVKWFMNQNPDDCLNEPIRVYKYQKWYMVYDGNHRLEANRRLGKKTIKANIMTPDPENIKDKLK